MFVVYYVFVALFTFWAVSTHAATRGKPIVALASAIVMPFALPLIPVIGLIALIYKATSRRSSKEQSQPIPLKQPDNVAHYSRELQRLLDVDPRIGHAVWSLTFMEGTYEQDQEVLKLVDEFLDVARKIRDATGRDLKEVLASALEA